MRIDGILDNIRTAPFVRRVRRTGWRALTTVTRRLRLGWAMLRRVWRRSLQFRVVAITLLASVTLVAAFGMTVAALITDQILDSKISASKTFVQKGVSIAADQLGGFAQSDDPGLVRTVPQVVVSLASGVDPN